MEEGTPQLKNIYYFYRLPLPQLRLSPILLATSAVTSAARLGTISYFIKLYIPTIA